MGNNKNLVQESPRAVYLFLLFACTVIVALLANQLFLEFLSGDTLYDIETAANFWHNKSFAYQNFPIAPCYFPDLFIYIVLELFTHNIAILHFAYLCIFFTVEFAVIFSLMRLSGLNKKDAFFGLSFASASFFLIIPPGMSLTEWKGSHFSSLLFSVFVFLYYLRNRNNPIRWQSFFALFLGSFIIYVSDNIIVMYLMAPLGLVILVDSFLNQSLRKTAFSFYAVFVLTILAGVKIPALIELLTSTSFSNNGSLFRIPAHEMLGQRFMNFPGLMLQHMKMFTLFYCMIGFYNLMVFIGLIVLIRQARQAKQDLSYVFRIVGFLYVSQILNVLLTIMAGKIDVIPQIRYLTPLFFYPTVALGVIVSHLYAKKEIRPFLNTLCVGIALVWISTYIYNYRNLFNKISLAQPYSADAACMDQLHDQYQIKNGVAEYWSVRPVRMMSKKGVKITQVNGNLKFFNQIDNEIHAYQDIKSKSRLSYQFVIVNELPKNKIEAAIGKPDRIVACPISEVWLYVNNSSNAKLNRYLLSVG